MAGHRAFPQVAPDTDPATAAVPFGGTVCRSEPVSFDANKPVTVLTVRNTGDRPVQVGSHFHFFEVNAALEFDRAAAFGQHLNIPSSTAMRFEPGDEREVKLVPYGGKRAAGCGPGYARRAGVRQCRTPCDHGAGGRCHTRCRARV